MKINHPSNELSRPEKNIKRQPHTEKASPWKIEDVIRGITPYLVLSLIVLGLLIAFPALSLWLPSRMFAK